MTDWQQPLVVALTQTTGLSIVHETVYENRLGFTEALADMGASSSSTGSAWAARRAGSAEPTSATRQ